MTLNTAHEGYEYQDLLTAFFILDEILNERDSLFKIDNKEHVNDKFDDLMIENSHGVFKKQIKYSNEVVNHVATKDDFATSNKYDLALYDLFQSWKNDRTHNLRVCLAWNEPVDKLKNFLKPSSHLKTFTNHPTKVFQVEIEKLWPQGQLPEKSWKKFRKESSKIEKTDFDIFCNVLIIETNFPKQSADTTFTGELETIIINQIQSLGIGEYPNNQMKPKSFALELLKLITRSRSRGLSISTRDIFRKFNIVTDFGSIEQVFPIDSNRNIGTDNFINTFIDFLEEEKKVILRGEPGSGKSWFVQNLKNKLQDIEYKVIKHYCYTELKDRFSKQRITLNIFYGNIIKDILEALPHLRERKKQRYASNLYELNELLRNIDTKAILIIDGLDHIERIFSFSQTELALNDIAIIDAINKLQVSDKVKILVVSQPIEDLSKLTGYKSYNTPKWSVDEVLEYFSKNEVADINISEDSNLSDILTIKSNGNPLYLSYLIEEIKSNNSQINIECLNSLPIYNFNLKNYYNYLIEKLNFDAIVPQVLSGASFSLTKNELKEITNQGQKVDKAISILQPVLNKKLTTGGYIIYHESFRRFIIEKLQTDEVNIEQAVFLPIIQWFENKGVFQLIKAYRYYFQLLFNVGKFEKIIEFLTPVFVFDSVYYGHSFDSIRNNYYYFAKAVIYKKDFPKIIIANEIKKILDDTEDQYYENFNSYFSALGHLKGFITVSDYLVFDEKPTLPLLAGLEVCYLCNQNQEPAPWGMYHEHFKGQKISVSEFKYYIRGLLVFKESENIVKLATDILKKHNNYIPTLANELKEYSDQDYIKELVEVNNDLREIQDYKTPLNKDEKQLFSLSQKIVKIKNLHDNEMTLIETFFMQMEFNADNKKLLDEIIKSFAAKNWFFNWLIYYVKIKILQSHKGGVTYHEVLNAFEYLSYDTDPFKGEPRACDLYILIEFIYDSINEGLGFLKKKEEWDEIIDLLVKICSETTTSLQKSLSGPLSTDKLFKLLDAHSNDTNRLKIILVFEQLIEEKQSYYLHSYITEFYFRLSKQYSLNKDTDNAEKAYSSGVQFLIGYTFRRDRTVEDLVYAIESFATLDQKAGSEYIKKIKALINSVTDHTDGKETKHFPIEWFQEYIKIDYNEASLYLLSQIKRTYYWIYEEHLQNLMIKANGEVNTWVELFIFLTFPITDKENFLDYGLTLVERTQPLNNSLAKILFENIAKKSKNRKDQEFSKEYIKKFNKIKTCFCLDVDNDYKIPKKKRYSDRTDAIEIIKANSIPRKEFADMSVQDLTDYFSSHKVKKTDIISLCYYFDNLDCLTPEVEELIKALVKLHEEYPNNNEIDLSILFESNEEMLAYFWVTKFVREQDGWNRFLQNNPAFEKAYSLNPELALNALIQQIEDFIQLKKYNRTISSSLINCLVMVGYEKETVKMMWNNLYDVTDSRLPTQEIIYWEEILENELKLSIEEIFACLLFSRLNSNTTERHHWTFSGISYMYEKHPEKMIKPTKWFLQNKEFFLTSNLILILEILYDINTHNKSYLKHFENELEKLIPSKYYLVNYITYKLLSKEQKLATNSPLLYYTASQEDINVFCRLNYRNEILNRKKFSFEAIVGKYKASFSKEYGKSMDFLVNRSIEKYVKNIYPSNYFIELINTDLSTEFEDNDDQQNLYNVLKIDYKTIVAQTNSYIKRPPNIKKPSEIKSDWEKCELEEVEWIRMGYYEHEMCEKGFREIKVYEVYEGIVFGSLLNKTIPFSSIRLYPGHLWGELFMSDLDESICTMLIQKWDTLEDYKILWINTILIDQLELTLGAYTDGLIAKNKKNEIVLRYNRWSTNYVGKGTVLGIGDEIPQLEGAELVCRYDYFKKICEFFETEKPYVYRLKVTLQE